MLSIHTRAAQSRPMQGGDRVDNVIFIVATAIKKARDGVDYDIQDGAICPFCGERAPVWRTMQWIGNIRLRYHKCKNPDCALCVCDETIRSWQEIEDYKNR